MVRGMDESVWSEYPDWRRHSSVVGGVPESIMVALKVPGRGSERSFFSRAIFFVVLTLILVSVPNNQH